jgi:hypothetical protein
MRALFTAITAIVFVASSQAFAEPQGELSLREGIQALQQQVSEMRALMEEMKTEIVRTRAEAQELRQALQASRPKVEDGRETEPIQRLEEEQQLLNAKVDEQYQTKVESASKYRVRLSGTVLMNMFKNRGVVDNLDFPSLAPEPGFTFSRSSIGATLRQSLIGLEVFGPQIKGARVGGDLQFDFAGGFPTAPDGVTFGLPRLRTGNLRLDWPKTSVVAGQDAPFFSPLSPSSIASIALPAFSYSGNLWSWIPYARVEKHIDVTESSNLLLQGGILDPLTGQVPASQFVRTAQAGEASRQPAYATRVAWSHHISDRELTLGGGSYYARHNWGFGRTVDAWAATSDWTVPLAERWEFSGEFYRGRGLGGLGGGLGRSALWSGPLSNPSTLVKGLRATGGWAQLKFRQTEKLEWNGAYGQDSVPAGDLRLFSFVQPSFYDPSARRNDGSLVNFIYRPRSDLLLSLEYRRFQTFMLSRESHKAEQISLSMGVLF